MLVRSQWTQSPGELRMYDGPMWRCRGDLQRQQQALWPKGGEDMAGETSKGEVSRRRSQEELGISIWQAVGRAAMSHLRRNRFPTRPSEKKSKQRQTKYIYKYIFKQINNCEVTSCSSEYMRILLLGKNFFLFNTRWYNKIQPIFFDLWKISFSCFR